MKKSGYIVSVQFFVEADPNVPSTMTKAFQAMDVVADTVSSLASMKMSHQFVRKHEVPDAVAGSEPVSSNEPVAVETLDLRAEFGKAMVEVGAPMLVKAIDDSIVGELKMPPIPAAMKR